MDSMKRHRDVKLEDEPPRAVGVQYASEEEQRNISIKNKEAKPKQKWGPVVDVSDGESKVQ